MTACYLYNSKTNFRDVSPTMMRILCSVCWTLVHVTEDIPNVALDNCVCLVLWASAYHFKKCKSVMSMS